MIEALLFQQLFVGTRLDDRPSFKNQDAVRVTNGRQAMSDDDRRAPLGHVAERALDGRFRLVVDR